MTPQSAIDRYLKVLALANQGVGGERDAAKATLERMEKRYPNIKMEAHVHVQASQHTNPSPHSSPEGRHWSDVYKEQQQERSWRDYIDQLSKAATDAFGWASQFASTAFGVREARVLAENHTTIRVKQNNTGSVTTTIRIPPEIKMRMDSVMDDERLQVFCSALAERFGNELYTHLYYELGLDEQEETDDET